MTLHRYRRELQFRKKWGIKHTHPKRRERSTSRVYRKNVSTVVLIRATLVPFKRSLRVRMRSISSSSASILSLKSVSYDCFASSARNLSSAFSTESLLITAMAAVFLEAERQSDPVWKLSEIVSPGWIAVPAPTRLLRPLRIRAGGAKQPHRGPALACNFTDHYGYQRVEPLI